MLKDLSFELHSLTVFRGLLSDCVIKNLLAFLDTADEGDERKSLDFVSFVSLKPIFEVTE